MAFYEVLDMSKHDRTKHLSFVRGDIAKYRHYAGIPLSPYSGPNIGTVFFFSVTPSRPDRSNFIYSYLSEIATYITRHLEQAVEALQGKRVQRFNQGVASLLNVEHAPTQDHTQLQLQHEDPESERHQLGKAKPQSDPTSYVFQMATRLLCNVFDFDGARIQEVSSSKGCGKAFNAVDSRTIAFHLGPNAEKLQNPSVVLLDRMLDLFPQGAVFQFILETAKIIAATGISQVTIVTDDVVSVELSRAFPKAGQMIFMPLWDTYHECNIGVVFGFALNQSKIFLGPTDLPAVSAFCTTIMTQVRRLEAKAMEKIKSDFLGSVSHEMRTPLHGILSSLELLSETIYDDSQNYLLKAAQYSGMSLLEIVERVLYLSKISSGAQSPGLLRSRDPDIRKTSQVESSNLCQSINAGLEEESGSVIQICERGLDRASQKLRLREIVRPDLFPGCQNFSEHRPIGVSATTPSRNRSNLVVVFDTNATWSCRPMDVAGFEIVFSNLLVCKYWKYFRMQSSLCSGQCNQIWRSCWLRSS